MRILVFSDSHSGLSFMRRCTEAIDAQVLIHLGDYYDDGDVLREEHPGARVYQVPGNCDRYRVPMDAMEIIAPIIGGVRFYLTHGHLHKVKLYLSKLVVDARAAGAAVALFGHTHQAYCQQEPDGMWVMNPGSCGYYGGSAGLIEVENGRVTRCRILHEEDLEEFK